MKLQMRTGRQTHAQKQLDLFSWSASRPDVLNEAGQGGYGHRQRPANSDCPFSEPYGGIPRRGR